MEYSEINWESYEIANSDFFKVIQSTARNGDTIWVHDYHLMLLPKLIRAAYKTSVNLGFFLHIPFPSSEVFKYIILS